MVKYNIIILKQIYYNKLITFFVLKLMNYVADTLHNPFDEPILKMPLIPEYSYSPVSS
jgi:hypothetical protein